MVWGMAASEKACGRSWDMIAFPRLLLLAIHKPPLSCKWFGVGKRVDLMFGM